MKLKKYTGREKTSREKLIKLIRTAKFYFFPRKVKYYFDFAKKCLNFGFPLKFVSYLNVSENKNTQKNGVRPLVIPPLVIPTTIPPYH